MSTIKKWFTLHAVCIGFSTFAFTPGALTPLSEEDKPPIPQFIVGKLVPADDKTYPTGQLYQSFDSGKSWQNQKLISYPPEKSTPDIDITIKPGHRELTRVTCLPSGEACIAVGSFFEDNTPDRTFIYTTLNSGAGWFGPVLLPLTPKLLSSNIKDIYLSESSYHCLAVGEGVLSEINTLHTHDKVAIAYRSNDCINWDLPPIIVTPSHNQTTLNSLSCDNAATYCVAVGQDKKNFALFSAVSKEYGARWRDTSPPKPYPHANMAFLDVACSSTGATCTAIGYITMGPFENETRWPISYASTDAGNTWTGPIFLPVPTLYNNTKLSSITCDTEGKQCLAVGNTTIGLFLKSPVIYRSQDAGKHWKITTAETLKTLNTLSDIHCSHQLEHCTIVGANMITPMTYTSTDAGNTWTGPVMLKPPAGFKQSQLVSIGGGRRLR